MAEKVFFTIIVVSLNAEKFIKITMDSIKVQSFENYEVVIKDGGSKDQTISFVPNDARFHLYQTPDKSLYDGMNQGIEKSTGKFLIFMNCGDKFAEKNVLQKAYENLKDKEYTMFYGDYVRDGIRHKQPSSLTEAYMFRTPLCHQTIFFNGYLLRHGYKYNTKFRILADYDLELRLMKKGPTGYMPEIVCAYQGKGVSESKEGTERKNKERRIILSIAFPKEKQLIYGLKYHLTLPKFRGWLLYSDNSPEFLKKTYQRLVNYINR